MTPASEAKESRATEIAFATVALAALLAELHEEVAELYDVTPLAMGNAPLAYDGPSWGAGCNVGWDRAIKRVLDLLLAWNRRREESGA